MELDLGHLGVTVRDFRVRFRVRGFRVRVRVLGFVG